jgi:hypothetical protein
MTPLERAVYRDLIDHIYIDGSIPNDLRILANLAAVSTEDLAAAWPVVSKRFIPCPDDPSSLTNANIEDEIRRRGEKTHAGSLGGYAKASRTVAGATQTEREKETERKKETHKHPCSSDDERDGNFRSFNNRRTDSHIRKPSVKFGDLTSEQEEWFTAWWSIYWRLVCKKAARVEFGKWVTTKERFEEVMVATKAQSEDMMGRLPENRPHGATWLRDERWTDALTDMDAQVQRINS